MKDTTTATAALRATVFSLALFGVGLTGCDEPPAPVDTGVYARCYDGAGLCLAPTLFDAGQLAMLEPESCQMPLLCVPRKLARGERATPCSSIAELEGRCVLERLPMIAKQRDRLPRSSCAVDERCAPCSDPFSGQSTGACTLPGDPGPTMQPKLLGQCCGGTGRCLPSNLVGPAQRAQLAQEACSADELCAPQFVIDEVPPARCVSINSNEGRCLPTCLPAVAAQQSRLPRASCPEGQLCAPCYDPFSGEATGSCALPADPGPTQPANVLNMCCDGAGRCVSDDLVDRDQRDNLARRECPATQLCAPQMFIDQRAPQPCRSLASNEGRCLPECLPLISQELEHLPQASCARGQRCAPCFDPFTAEPSGACSLVGDSGPSEPPQVFAQCCEGAGYCVPPDLVAVEQQPKLGRDSCNAAQLCVPKSFVAATPPTQCASVGGFEGRCLPSCLPLVAAQAERLPRASCTADQRCAPCFDPFTGEPSGACTLPGDRGPSSNPTQFTRCCDAAAYCVPAEFVPESQRENLGPDTCRAGELCLPAQLTTNSAPTTCSSIAGAEGRCLSTCVPLVARQAKQLPRASCSEGTLCAPCFDPFSGQATGACTLPGDRGPTQAAVTFASCCVAEGMARGRCVPPELIPADKRSLLLAADCSADKLCLPASLIPPATSLPACRSSAGSEGACAPTCILSATQNYATTQGTCQAWEKCVPCVVLGEPSGVCE